MDSSFLQSDTDIPSRLSLSSKEIDEEMKEAEQMTLEMDHVSDMLTRLASSNTEVAKAAQEEIDNYLLLKEHRKQQDLIQKDITEGCNTTTEKTVINNNESVHYQLLIFKRTGSFLFSVSFSMIFSLKSESQ